MPRPRRRERSADRRQDILQAAAACFRRSGFRGAGIADICREAGISPGNLYYYFESKEALIEAIAASDLAKLHALLARIDSPADLVTLLLQSGNAAPADILLEGTLGLEILAEASRNPNVKAILQRHYAAVRETVVESMRAAQARGEMNRTTDPMQVALLFGALFEGMNAVGTIDPNFLESGRSFIEQVMWKVLGEN